MGSPEHKQKIWNIISTIKTGMMVTRDGQYLRGRPMELVQNSYDGTLWFFTALSSSKVDEVMHDRDVCITFSDFANQTHVSLSGKARVNRDQKLIDKFWNSSIATWFPQGKESDDVALLEIKVEHGEHWDAVSNPMKYTWEVARATVSGDKPHLEENQKF